MAHAQGRPVHRLARKGRSAGQDRSRVSEGKEEHAIKAEKTNEAHRGRLVLVLGGARSGKSRFAEDVGRLAAGPVVYVATARVEGEGASGDEELRARVERHRAARPESWTTLEPGPSSNHEPLVAALDLIDRKAEVTLLIVDCATLWLAWELSREFQRYSVTQLAAHLEKEADHFVASLQRACENGVPVLVVSNETGSGVVPGTPAGRHFRDALGLLNTRLSAAADVSLLMIAGNPLCIKGAENLGVGAGVGVAAPAGALSPLYRASESALAQFLFAPSSGVTQ